MENIKKAIAALSALILAHHRRIRAYMSLRETTSRGEIKSLCERHIHHSRQIVKDLSNWRAAYGGYAKRLDESAGSDTWLQVRLLLSFNAEKTVTSRCEQLDRETLRMYELSVSHIPSAAIGDLESHMKTLKVTMRTLHDLSERKQVVGSLATK
jgi:hypothetical protein